MHAVSSSPPFLMFIAMGMTSNINNSENIKAS